jgi:integrase
MSLAKEIQDYLNRTGESMRGLSLRAGLSEKAVVNVIQSPGCRPTYSTLAALSGSTGLDLFRHLPEGPITYAELVQRLESKGARRLAKRVMWLCRSAGWHANVEIVCPDKARAFLNKSTPARFSLTPGSFATYKSEALSAIESQRPRQRPRGVKDISGVHREIYDACVDAKLPQWVLGILGPYLVFLYDRGVAPEAADSDLLDAYYAHRLEVSGRDEETCRKHVKEVAGQLKRLTARPELARFRMATPDHPFEDKRSKFGVDDALLVPLLEEFDQRIAPWARGQTSRDGIAYKDFIALLDAEEAAAHPANATPLSEKKARLRARKASGSARRDTHENRETATVTERVAQRGFLIGDDRWNSSTLRTRRGFVISLAKALHVTTDVMVESFEELTDPEFLEEALAALAEINAEEMESSYLSTVSKCMRKIARDYVVRSDDDLKKIDALVETYDRPYEGISPRNKAKLKQFDDVRIQRLIDMTDLVVADVNVKVAFPRSADSGISPEAARDIMAALAHAILMEKAPRSANVTGARLEWVGFVNDNATITVPAAQVKMRDPREGPLVIPLSPHASALLRTYLDKVRPTCLASGDERNPYLFPSQDLSGKSNGKPYTGILSRVVRLVHRHVGVQINPHLYRHLIGWIWLRESLDNLPKVQKLLGHKSIKTTITYYAEIDETLALQDWQDHLEGRRTASAARTPRRKAA